MPDMDRPLMFVSPMLAHPLTEPDKQLDDLVGFQAEWKWDGIRAQYHRHGDQWRLYSRTGENISGGFPDLSELPDGSYILDGELLVLRGDDVGSFGDLQQRLNRKKPSKKLMEDSPAIIMAYDLLLLDGTRCASRPLHERRRMLEELVASKQHERLRLSAEVSFGDIEQCDALRNNPPHPAMEGLMVKRRDSAYVPGRPRGP
jgi:ATP-dependent DNA ligase